MLITHFCVVRDILFWKSWSKNVRLTVNTKSYNPHITHLCVKPSGDRWTHNWEQVEALYIVKFASIVEKTYPILRFFSLNHSDASIAEFAWAFEVFVTNNFENGINNVIFQDWISKSTSINFCLIAFKG